MERGQHRAMPERKVMCAVTSTAIARKFIIRLRRMLLDNVPYRMAAENKT